ncbi:flocculation protein FLO11 isoform X4 [Nilaparvata lugens]|uniref:flocculation protein FLO11 isoform X4 n=1 Tax=Nilaparvata lugens TaxID=108931 RepID=UPI00193D720C|nr:flocculation protein FLO11 isoform X4 [Nilaparvata lugens]
MSSRPQPSTSAAGPSNARPTGADAAPRVPVHLQGAIKKTTISETTKTTKKSIKKTESAAKPLEKMEPTKFDDEDDLPIADLIPPTKIVKTKTCRPNVDEVRDVLPDHLQKMMINAPSHDDGDSDVDDSEDNHSDDDTSLSKLHLDHSQRPLYRPARKFVKYAPVYRRTSSGIITVHQETVARAQDEGAWSAALGVESACKGSGASSAKTKSSSKPSTVGRTCSKSGAATRPTPAPSKNRKSETTTRPTSVASAVGRTCSKSGAATRPTPAPSKNRKSETTTRPTSVASAVGRTCSKSGAATRPTPAPSKNRKSETTTRPTSVASADDRVASSRPISALPVRAVPTRSVTARIAEAALLPAQCLRSSTKIKQGPPIRNVTELRQSTGQRASLSPDYKEIGSLSMVFCCFCYRCSQQRNINMVVQKCGHLMCNECLEQVKRSFNEELDGISCPRCTKTSKIYDIFYIFINE